MQHLSVHELFSLTPWRKPQIDLSIYEQLPWACAHTGLTYIFGDSEAAMEGARMRILICPPGRHDFSVVKIRGLFKRRIVTEYAAPSRSDLNAYFDKVRELGVIQSSIRF